MATFDKLVVQSDTAVNLACCGQVTDAFLYTGDERYRRWVLAYVDLWLARTRHNGGIIPDNVGANGLVGGARGGQWWGGLYGWNCYVGGAFVLNAVTIAAQCAVLLSGDLRYADLLRSQLEYLLAKAKFENVKTDAGDDGHDDRKQMLAPHRFGPDGWEHSLGAVNSPARTLASFRFREFGHLYDLTLDPRDLALIERLKAGDSRARRQQWGTVKTVAEADGKTPTRIPPYGDAGYARHEYYRGRNPDWPAKVLAAEQAVVAAAASAIEAEPRSKLEIVRDNVAPPAPVATQALVQMTCGSLAPHYNGGLLTSAVCRHFDPVAKRPGLPPGVAALVEDVSREAVRLRLVNTSAETARRLVVQAGAFGQHAWGPVRVVEWHGGGGPGGGCQASSSLLHESPPESDAVVAFSRGFELEVPPASEWVVEAAVGGRFVHTPSYRFPWHPQGEPMPSPFQ
jgi:hypothetical protein